MTLTETVVGLVSYSMHLCLTPIHFWSFNRMVRVNVTISRFVFEGPLKLTHLPVQFSYWPPSVVFGAFWQVLT